MDVSEKKDYPPRLYGDNGPVQERSLNHGSYIHYLLKAKETLGNDVWVEMKASALGPIVCMAENNFTWCAKTAHYFLTHQLQIHRPKEMWCLIGDDPMRFSLYEFGQVTGLRCAPYDAEDEEDVDHTSLWAKMSLAIGDGPHWNDLARVLKICRGWHFLERRTVGFLCLIALGVFGFQKGCRISFKYAKKAFNPDVMNRFQWGRLAFETLIDSIK